MGLKGAVGTGVGGWDMGVKEAVGERPNIPPEPEVAVGMGLKAPLGAGAVMGL